MVYFDDDVESENENVMVEDEKNDDNQQKIDDDCEKSESETEAFDVKEACKRVEELENEVKNLQDLNLRLRAEFDNFRKRTSKEKMSVYSSAQIDCVLKFLPIIDGLEQGLELVFGRADDDVVSGFKMLIESFNQVLKNLGIESFGNKGDLFDPKFHNAIKTLKVDGFGEGLVYEVLQKGYCKGEDVVRHAVVVVANP